MRKLTLYFIFILVLISFVSALTVQQSTGGDITGVLTPDSYLTGGCLTGTCSLFLSISNLKTTLDTYYVNLVGDTMTGSLNMSANNITEINFLSFNVTSCPEEIDTTLEGFICWDQDKKTMNMVTGLGNILQIGQENFKIFKNKAGKTIYAGQVVSMNGSVGEIATGVLGNGNVSDAQISNLHMVTIPSCNANAECVAVNLGEVHDVPTSDFAQGTVVYLSCDGSGNMTDTLPVLNECYNYRLGTVLRSHATTGILDFFPEVDREDGNTFSTVGVLNDLEVLGNIYSNNSEVVTNKYTGWVEYVDNDYNSTNRLTVGTTRYNLTMINYTKRDKEKPVDVIDFFNGTHLIAKDEGDSYLIRFRYKAEPLAINVYCEVYNDINGAVEPLSIRTLTFPRGINVEIINSFTNFEYALDTWVQYGGVLQIECSNNVEFWDIELSIARLHRGRGTYP